MRKTIPKSAIWQKIDFPLTIKLSEGDPSCCSSNQEEEDSYCVHGDVLVNLSCLVSVVHRETDGKASYY